MTTGATTTPPTGAARPPDDGREAAPGAGTRGAGLFATLARAAGSEYAVLGLTAIYALAVWPFVPELFGGENLANVASNMLPLLAVALGQMLVLIAGGIDLSATSVIAMASVVGAAVMNDRDGVMAGRAAAVPAAVACMLAAGLLVGLFNGAAITVLRLPAFIVTLATMMTGGGAAVWATRSKNISMLPDAFLGLGQGSVMRVPAPLLIVGTLAAVTHAVLSRTVAGRWLYAVGLNARAARVSGVPVRRVTILAYAASGLCAAVASVLLTARLETGSPTLGQGMLLDVIGAAVIGGTSLFGGRGKVLWTVAGVLLFTLISNTMNLVGLSDEKILVVKGCVILAAAALDRARRRAS